MYSVVLSQGSRGVCSIVVSQISGSVVVSESSGIFYYATIAYHVGLNAVLGLPHPGPTS